MADSPTQRPKLTSSGGMSTPPPGAPYEVAVDVPTDVQILGPDGRLHSAADLARANEKDLSVYAPQPLSEAAMAAIIGPERLAELKAQGLVGGGGGVVAPVVVAPATQVVQSATADPLITPAPPGIVTSSVKGVDHVLPGRLRRARGARPAVMHAGDSNDTVDRITNTQTDRDRSTVAGSVSHAGAVSDLQSNNRATIPAGAVEGVNPVAVAGSVVPPPSATVVVAEPYRPAASNTDSPSRGVPRPIADPGKRITGGFGDVGEAQYFPLDGLELKVLIEALLDDLHARIQDDLRFARAMTYPRVRARVEIIVECYAADAGFVIPKIAKPHEKTPIDVARSHADECVFILSSQRQEFDEDNQPQSAPNAIRQELGMGIPRKQSVQTPGGRMIVDVVENVNTQGD